MGIIYYQSIYHIKHTNILLEIGNFKNKEVSCGRLETHPTSGVVYKIDNKKIKLSVTVFAWPRKLPR